MFIAPYCLKTGTETDPKARALSKLFQCIAGLHLLRMRSRSIQSKPEVLKSIFTILDVKLMQHTSLQPGTRTASQLGGEK